MSGTLDDRIQHAERIFIYVWFMWWPIYLGAVQRKCGLCENSYIQKASWTKEGGREETCWSGSNKQTIKNMIIIFFFGTGKQELKQWVLAPSLFSPHTIHLQCSLSELEPMMFCANFLLWTICTSQYYLPINKSVGKDIYKIIGGGWGWRAEMAEKNYKHTT